MLMRGIEFRDCQQFASPFIGANMVDVIQMDERSWEVFIRGRFENPKRGNRLHRHHQCLFANLFVLGTEARMGEKVQRVLALNYICPGTHPSTSLDFA